MEKIFIEIENCRVKNKSKTLLTKVDWRMEGFESWVLTGDAGGGKEDFAKALSGDYEFVPNAGGFFSSVFAGRTAVVSFEEAARVVEEERRRDQSEWMGKTDPGRTAREYILEACDVKTRFEKLESLAVVQLCGVEPFLDRGLRFLSTGEIRRVLLCRAFLSQQELLILSEPLAGIDATTRETLMRFFEGLTERQLKSSRAGFHRVLFCMEKSSTIPLGVNRVLEFSGGRISFNDTYVDWKKMCELQRAQKKQQRERRKSALLEELERISSQAGNAYAAPDSDEGDELVRFEAVNVGWEGRRVLRNLSWCVHRGEHYLIQGPNGAGKTTIMELITGDNMQVFREKVFLFGKRRGSGESVWDIKKRLGIVSHRLHTEYRMVGGTDLLSVVISGFKDSIGLYEKPSDFELMSAKAWLNMAGFSGREKESFAHLSFGEQRAVLILRAAVKLPQLLILDEPCHGLDEGCRAMVLDLLETIGETGKSTLLHVTHDPTEVLQCERRVLRLMPTEEPMYEISQR